ncbi:TPA: DUF4651 domain-containing protein [Streptococcus equi subsp. zooepidemicus]|nr:DUF4651 domain-containing protein [Streptococcus equi subsp. zooepidemicus]HEL0779485.1 DUF4651 domain-containing protein [Streptococcus equi subsp. zooepidemicus]HEL1321336.1 DUF4651 domain-containing protein [Streptococcus equi subsp. zooepidemicus]
MAEIVSFCSSLLFPFCDKIKSMSGKKTRIVSGLIGLGLLAGLGLRLKEVYQERERQRVLAELRAFFSALGEIEVLYINSFSSKRDDVTGGLVMTDGKTYTYHYHKGSIDFKEDLT